jgi:hypothetical protein
MQSKSSRFVLAAISFLFATALSAQHVKTHYDRSANFAQYKTYSWEQVKTREPLDVDRIKSAVNAALAAKGWTRVESGGDVWIVAIEGGWRWRGFGAFGPTTDTYEDRTLTVDLVDTKTKKLLWRGSSTDRLSDNSDKNTKNLDKGVEKLFKMFPPSSSRLSSGFRATDFWPLPCSNRTCESLGYFASACNSSAARKGTFQRIKKEKDRYVSSK